MIYDLNKKDVERIESLEQGYKRLLAEVEAQIEKLKPETEPPEDIEERLAWIKSGSPEWREARAKKVEIYNSHVESRSDLIEKIYDEHFQEIAKDQDAIVQDAKEAIDYYLEIAYETYQKVESGQETADNALPYSLGVQATATGLRLNAEKTLSNISITISRHIKKLKDDSVRTALINSYISQKIASSPYMGEIGDALKDYQLKLETTEEGYKAYRPKNFVASVGRVQKLAFSGQLMRPLEADEDQLFDVCLQPKKSKKEVIARVAIDYREMLKSGAITEIPELNDGDLNAHDAILSLINAGNYAFTITMIYRVMIGKPNDRNAVPKEMKDIIEAALLKFKATVDIVYSEVDRAGNRCDIKLHEPILTYIRGSGYINNTYVDDIIIVPEDERFTPPFLKWAKANNNELDTRDIKLLNVPRLYNGKESMTIKMTLYRRIIQMRNTFERKKGGKYELSENQRIIRYDYIYKKLGLDESNISKDKRHDIKDKIDRCMKYWASEKIIAGYEHLRDNDRTFYAVRVSFLERQSAPLQ